MAYVRRVVFMVDGIMFGMRIKNRVVDTNWKLPMDDNWWDCQRYSILMEEEDLRPDFSFKGIGNVQAQNWLSIKTTKINLKNQY